MAAVEATRAAEGGKGLRWAVASCDVVCVTRSHATEEAVVHTQSRRGERLSVLKLLDKELSSRLALHGWGSGPCTVARMAGDPQPLDSCELSTGRA